MDPKILKQLELLIAKALKNVATKDDLEGFATKDDLKGFATKDDLRAMEARFDTKFATKVDFEEMESRFEKKFATKADLKNMENRLATDFASKSDLQKMSQELKKELHAVKYELLTKIEDVDNGVAILIQSTDDHKADKKELYTLRKRVEKLERKVFSN